MGNTWLGNSHIQRAEYSTRWERHRGSVTRSTD